MKLTKEDILSDEAVIFINSSRGKFVPDFDDEDDQKKFIRMAVDTFLQVGYTLTLVDDKESIDKLLELIGEKIGILRLSTELIAAKRCSECEDKTCKAEAAQ